ncbi:MAG: cupin domain-containing protein [Candidatus Acidiferrales bacterium]
MKSMVRWALAVGFAVALALVWAPSFLRRVVQAQSRKPYSMQLLYSGPDGLAYVKEIQVAAGTYGVANLLPVAGEEVHRTPAGFSIGWHVEKRRQYLITLSGRGEIDIAGGKKIILTPGSILLVENTTGKGHETRTLGNKPWVSLWMPLKDQKP